MSTEKKKRAQTMGEELANTISHGVGALLAVVGAVPLIARAVTGETQMDHIPETAQGRLDSLSSLLTP